MAYVLLWIEYVGVILLAVALLSALLARVRQRWLRTGLACLLLIVFVGGHAAMAAAVLCLRYALFIDTPVFGIVSLCVVIIAIALFLVVRALRYRDGVLPGSEWPRARLATAFAVVTALFVMTWWNLDLTVQRRMANLRLEMGVQALQQAPPRVPDSENAALVYEKAFERLGNVDKWPPQWSADWESALKADGPELDADDPELRSFLAEKQTGIGLLHRAAEKPGYYAERLWHAPSVDWRFEELLDLGQAARLLVLDARVKLADGDTPAAIRNINTVFQMSEHLAADPLLVASLISSAIQQMAINELEAIMQSASPEDLAAVELIDSVSYQRRLRRSLLMEQAFGVSLLTSDDQVAALRACGYSEEDVVKGGVPGWTIYRVLLLPRDVASSQRLWAKLHALAKLPFYEAKKKWKDAEVELISGPTGLLTKLVTPAVAVAHERMAEADARQALAETALAMNRYRLKHGEYPENLGQLVPEFMYSVPTDPFDGKPIKLFVGEDKLVLYSIGDDMDDDGGLQRWDRETEDGDILFELEKTSPHDDS